jgi:hypothetical protein
MRDTGLRLIKLVFTEKTAWQLPRADKRERCLFFAFHFYAAVFAQALPVSVFEVF